MTDHLSVRSVLLDQQIVDCDRLPVGRVDDLEIAVGAGEVPRVTALLTGSEALGDRLGGTAGRWLSAVSARLRPRSAASGPPRISPALIKEIEPLIELSAEFGDLDGIAGLEHWLAEHFVERLPGTGHARK